MPSYGRKSLEGRANMQDVKNACMILNTAEYCRSTSLQACLFVSRMPRLMVKLEERLKGKIDDQFKEEVSFETERETFTS